MPSESSPAISKYKQIGIVAIIAAFLAMIFLDETGVAVTIASIQRDLGLSSTLTSWIVNAYLLSLSAFILLFARMSDSLGIKQLFSLGIIIFAFASVSCALSFSGMMLIISRAVQGIGASLGLATYILILDKEIPKEKRGKALGTSAALGAIFLSAGPLIGGFFSSILSWRYIFWINLPVCLICLIITYFATKKCASSFSFIKKFDAVGLIIYMIAVVSIVFALMEGSRFGWETYWILGLIVLSFVCFLCFLFFRTLEEKSIA